MDLHRIVPYTGVGVKDSQALKILKTDLFDGATTRRGRGGVSKDQAMLVMS